LRKFRILKKNSDIFAFLHKTTVFRQAAVRPQNGETTKTQQFVSKKTVENG